MKKILFLLLISTVTAVAQKIPDYGFNKVRLTPGDKIIQAELKPVKHEPEAATDRLYFWYGSNLIHTTQGGYSGRLLNGDYTEYYLNKNLKEQGLFKLGLKTGVWKSWAENGNLSQVYSWKNGLKNGKFTLYNADGRVQQAGKYSDGLLDGPQKTFDQNGAVTVSHYKHGVIVNRKQSFWQKINPFKRSGARSKPKKNA